MTSGELLTIRDMLSVDDNASWEREKYEESLAAVYEMLRLEKAYLSRMMECCHEFDLPKPKPWVRIHRVIDAVEADVQWKENQLLELPINPSADDVESLWALWSGRPFLGCIDVGAD
ncbi:hypothetical protein FOZ63_011704 [Perkinsus olseni]|uniref:Uncharacterized protein n=2 Tax=Perkinsus olseni TaxID=32597 RepID=A0A7J6S8T3_PEROL|nr:hypothetical protein FOZ63_011704 [Perkinsus olseni]